MPANRKKFVTPILILIVVSGIALMFKNDRYVMDVFISIVQYVIIATGINLLMGFTGQITLGHAAFYGIGAYTAGILAKDAGMPFLLRMFFAVVVCFVFGIILGLPCTRLSAAYLAIATIGFNMILRLVMLNETALTGGSAGFIGIPKMKLFGQIPNKITYFFIEMLFAVAVYVIFVNIVNSKAGRAFQSIKTNPIAAASMGVNVNYYKLMSFAISASFAGIAGCLYAYNIGYLSPDTFSVDVSTKFLTMVIIGGLGDIYGSIAGAITLGLLPEFLRELGNFQMSIYGLLIILVLRFTPKGIMGGIRGLTRMRVLKAPAKIKGGSEWPWHCFKQTMCSCNSAALKR